MKLILLGDIAFFGKCSLTSNPKAFDYFEEIAKETAKADYVVGNLETPFSIKKRSGAKSAYICSDPENIELLKRLHVDAVTLANNHMFDYGLEGYEATKQLLKENNIDFFGVEGKCLNLDLDNNRLCFEGFCCYSSNPLQTVPYGDYGVNQYNVSKAEELLASHEREERLSVLAIHAGLEHVNYPSIEHVKAARLLAEKHSYIYYGHHPHVAQGIERINGSLIAYSLGNFCFDDIWTSSDSSKPFVELTENNRSSFILKVTIEDNNIKNYEVIPIYIGKDKLYVGKGTNIEDITKYTKVINEKSPSDYESMRHVILNERYAARKEDRGLLWYIKRLRPRYVKLYLEGIKNKKLYYSNVISNISQ